MYLKPLTLSGPASRLKAQARGQLSLASCSLLQPSCRPLDELMSWRSFEEAARKHCTPRTDGTVLYCSSWRPGLVDHPVHPMHAFLPRLHLRGGTRSFFCVCVCVSTSRSCTVVVVRQPAQCAVSKVYPKCTVPVCECSSTIVVCADSKSKP